MTSHLGRDRRIGLSRKDHRALGLRSLHAGARDSRAAELPSGATPQVTEDEIEDDIFAPPKDSDDSDAAQDSDISKDSDDFRRTIKQIPSSAPSTQTSYDEASERSGFFELCKKKTYSYKASQTMSRKNSRQIARAPKKRHLPPGYSGSKRESGTENAFQPVPPAVHVDSKLDSSGFIDIPSLNWSSAKSDTDIFIAPPPALTLNSLHGDETSSTHSLEAFVDPPEIASKSRSAIRDDLDEYLNRDEKKKKRAKDVKNTVTPDPSPPKKRKTTPEPVFIVPPKITTPDPSEVTLPDATGFWLSDAYNPVENSPNEEQSESASLYNIAQIDMSNTIQSISRYNSCSICQAPVDSSLLEAFREEKNLSVEDRLTVRQQELLHLRHSKLDAKVLWQIRHYPTIEWRTIPERLSTHKAYLSSTIEGYLPSYHLSRLKENLPARGRKTVILADEMKTGESGSQVLGYYGTRGQRVIGDWLLSECSVRLKEKSKDPDFKLAGGVGGFVQKVLIPEAIQLLVMDDMAKDPALYEGARLRSDLIIAQGLQDVQDTADVSRNVNINVHDSVRAAAIEAGITTSVSELDKESQKSWIARFIAMESASCGVLLSEEIEDVVPISIEEEP